MQISGARGSGLELGDAQAGAAVAGGACKRCWFSAKGFQHLLVSKAPSRLWPIGKGTEAVENLKKKKVGKR